jgi:hypothetical protein
MERRGTPTQGEAKMTRTDYTATRIEAGRYEYRGHHICREEHDGPEGGERVYWSIGGRIGTTDEKWAIAENPHLDTMRAAREWLDSHLGPEAGASS